jgi:hypothetical protein
MTKEEFIARCEMIYDLWLVPHLKIAKDYAEATERFLWFQKEQFCRKIDRHRKRKNWIWWRR